MFIHPNTICFLFFFNDTATTEIYTLSLHDALPICPPHKAPWRGVPAHPCPQEDHPSGCLPPESHLTGFRPTRPWSQGPEYASTGDRKSTRLNSSHANISYAVFCLKKKKK